MLTSEWQLPETLPTLSPGSSVPKTPAGEQIKAVAATPKHFTAYSLEDSDGFTRHDFAALVNEEDLQLTYLPGFKTAVQQAKPLEVMCMYSRYGLSEAPDQMVPACLHGDYNNGLMRKEWGWTDGLLVADCDAIADVYKTHHYTADAANASALGVRGGCDLDCGSTYSASTGLPTALKEGLVDASDIDTALTRVFTTRIAVGDLDDPSLPWVRPYTSINSTWLDTPSHRQLSLEAARQAITLLDNSAGVLPLKLPSSGADSSPLKIACVGPVCEDSLIHMGSKHDYCPSTMQSFVDGL